MSLSQRIAARRAAQQEADARNAEARAAYLRDFDARAARRAQAWADYSASRA
jgi:hypothetical protein